MSRNYKNTNQSNNQSNNKSVKSVKPFCKVCQDAGKTEAEYTSHFVRRTTDPNSEVICPTLLATECRYCHGLGHTLSRCPIRENNNRRREEETRRRDEEARYHEAEARRREEIRLQEIEAIKIAQKNNKYALFEEDDAEPEPEPKAVVDEFPALCSLKSTAPKSAAPKSAAPKPVSFATAFKSSAAPSNRDWRVKPVFVEECHDDEDEEYEYSARYEHEEDVPAVESDSDDDEDHYRNSVMQKYEQPVPYEPIMVFNSVAKKYERSTYSDDDW